MTETPKKNEDFSWVAWLLQFAYEILCRCWLCTKLDKEIESFEEEKPLMQIECVS